MQSTEQTAPPEAGQRVPALQVGLTFLKIGMTAFGGGLSAHFYHSVVESKRWVDPRTFLEGMVLTQIAPGSNVTSLAAFLGMRMSGLGGAILAAFGVVVPGALFMIAISPFYLAFQDLPEVNRILRSIASVAVGLLVAIAIQAARDGNHTRAGWGIAIATAIAFGVFRLPLWLILLTIGPVSVWLHRPSAIK